MLENSCIDLLMIISLDLKANTLPIYIYFKNVTKYYTKQNGRSTAYTCVLDVARDVDSVSHILV